MTANQRRKWIYHKSERKKRVVLTSLITFLKQLLPKLRVLHSQIHKSRNTRTICALTEQKLQLSTPFWVFTIVDNYLAALSAK